MKNGWICSDNILTVTLVAVTKVADFVFGATFVTMEA